LWDKTVSFGERLFRRTIVWRGTRYRLGSHGLIRAASALG
jgi:hypothetical protein